MEFLKKSLYTLSAVSMMGLWSCASEEMLPVDQPTATGETITLTVTVDRGNANTRTLLQDDGNGGLTSVWKGINKDKLLLVDTRGNVQAHLYLKDGDGCSKGVFEGTFSNYKEDEIYNLWYMMGDSWVIPSGNADCSFKIQTGKQAYFSLEELSAKEIMSSNQTNAPGGYKIEVRNSRGYIMEDVKLESRLAMARFSLDGLPEGTKGTLYIYNADGNGKTPVEIEFKSGVKFSPNGTIRYTTKKNNVDYDRITIENAEAGKDVYVALIPATYRLGFQFVAEDGTEYVYERENATDLKYGVYYTDGNGGGISVPFTEVKQAQEWSVIWKDSLSDEIYKNDPVKGIAPQEYDTAAGKPAEPKKDGYKFVGWTYNGKPLPDSITLTEENLSIEILAQWEEDKHTVTTPGYGHGSFN